MFQKFNMETQREMISRVSSTPTSNLLSLIFQPPYKSTKHQKLLLSEMLRHLLISYTKTIDENDFYTKGKCLFEHGLQISYPHSSHLPDHVWAFVLNIFLPKVCNSGPSVCSLFERSSTVSANISVLL